MNIKDITQTFGEPTLEADCVRRLCFVFSEGKIHPFGELTFDKSKAPGVPKSIPMDNHVKSFAIDAADVAVLSGIFSKYTGLNFKEISLYEAPKQVK